MFLTYKTITVCILRVSFGFFFSEPHLYVFLYTTRAPDVSLSHLSGEKCQGGLRVPGHRPGPRPVLRVSSGQPAGGQHLPQHGHLRIHRRPQEKQRQPSLSQSVPPHLGPNGRREALHLHLQGISGQQLEGEQYGGSSQ